MGIFRIEGAAWASVAFCSFMLVRYGIKGILDVRRPWRLLLLLAVVAVGLFGGYRGRVFIIGMFFVVQLFLEGFWRTWLMPVVLILLGAAAGVVFACSDRMPEAVQRSLSFLPGVKVDPVVAEDAAGTVEWRENMWRELVPQIPAYFWLGEGYGFTENDLFIATQMVQNGMAPTYEIAMLSSEYHNGPLLVLLPFGIFGTLAFVWFLIAGLAGGLAQLSLWRSGPAIDQHVSTDIFHGEGGVLFLDLWRVGNRSCGVCRRGWPERRVERRRSQEEGCERASARGQARECDSGTGR